MPTGQYKENHNFSNTAGTGGFHKGSATINSEYGQAYPKSVMKRTSTGDGNNNRLNTQDIHRAMDQQPERDAQPNRLQQVIVLNNQESKSIIAELGLLKENNDNKPGVLDLLINELMALKGG